MTEQALYRLVAPDNDLIPLVNCFWVVVDEDSAPSERKIIPDGYPELIFHFGDPYEIRLGDRWEPQAHCLAAGQFSRHFHLRNTGRTAMIGIKLQPWALAQMTGRPMHEMKERVLPFHDVCDEARLLETAAFSSSRVDEQISLISQALRTLRPRPAPPALVVDGVGAIIDHHGALSVSEICMRLGANERALERAFAQWIGLTPKLYSRLIRLSSIFKGVAGEGPRLRDLPFDAGYYDQPHFQREFKRFTGETPSRYEFAQQCMANLFLNRSS